MGLDVRKIVLILVIAVLYAFFVQAFIDAVHQGPEYEDFCGHAEKPIPARPEGECAYIQPPECGRDGYVDYAYDEYGCITSAECNYCNRDLREAEAGHNFIVFLLSTLFGLIAIGIALFLPVQKNPLHEWVGSGFLFGGLITLFIGTARYYEDMALILRPIILLFELSLVIFLFYRNLSGVKVSEKGEPRAVKKTKAVKKPKKQ